MISKQLNEWRRLAEAHGIQSSYIDVSGITRHASEGTLRRVLEIFGAGAATEREAGERLRELKEKRTGELAEPVVVRWKDRRGRAVPLKLDGKGRAKAVLRLEDGSERPLKAGARGVELPVLPAGYHTLVVEHGERRRETLVISAPGRVYDDSSAQREWGLFAPLYAVHSEESWGAGNFSDWTRFTCWAGSRGARVVAALPILASFLGERPFEPSPYSPASRLFWNEFYVNVTGLLELAECKEARRLVESAGFKTRLARVRAAELIDYREEARLRREVLELLARKFFEGAGAARRREFEAFVRARPVVKDYAEFRAATEQAGESWQAWKTGPKGGKLRRSDFSEVARDYHLYVQWAAQEQMEQVLAACEEERVKFYLDLPLGVNPDSYDAWRFRDSFAAETSAGAPPDAFFTKGQDWGFAPLHPERIRENHYRYVIDYLRFQMTHTGMLRLDHVMALHRLYWVPRGLPASEGAYVRYRAEELYAILALESHRHRCVLVGENLGTVPPEVNEAMERHGVRKMYVMQFEEPKGGKLAAPERHAVASLNTHDMPPFAAHWKGADIPDRVDLGLLPQAAVKNEKAARARWRKNMAEYLRNRKLLEGKPNRARVLAAVLCWLAKSPAQTVLVSLEDLWGEERPQNVPGTSSERPNWKRKAALTLEEIEGSKGIAKMAAEIQKFRQQ